MSNDWAEYAEEGYDNLLQVAPYRRLQLEVVDRAGIKDGMKVLDLCCGTGNLLLALQDKGVRCQVWGVDREPAMLSRAELKAERYRSFGGQARFIRADVNKRLIDLLTSTSGLFKRIVSINAFYDLASPAATLLEIAGLAAPGAVLVVTTPRPGADKEAIFKEHLRLFEAGGGDPELERRRLTPILKPLQKPNDSLLQDPASHFPDPAGILKWYESTGWRVTEITKTYANQNWLIIAERERVR